MIVTKYSAGVMGRLKLLYCKLNWVADGSLGFKDYLRFQSSIYIVRLSWLGV